MGVVIGLGEGQWVMPFRLTGDLGEMVITCGFQDDAAQTPNAIAESLSNAFLGLPTFAASSIANVWTLGPGRVVVNRTLGTFQGTGTVTRVGTNGTISTTPQNSAVLVQKRTSRGGRSGRGRMYVPIVSIAESNITSTGTILESVRASWALDFNAFLSAAAALGLFLVLQHSAPPVGPPLPRDAITSFTVDPVIATQRGRLRR